MTRQIVHTEQAPAAIGPYSQAVVSNGVVTTAGQIALDPGSGELLGGGDTRAETHQVLKNLKEVLNAAGSGLGQCLRCDVYMVDLGEFDAMNEVYASYFEVDPPARVTVQVSALPKGARVEINAVATVLA